jgi:Flp pilus assembly protein TadG
VVVVEAEARRVSRADRLGRERGQAMVEFSLVIVPVLLICFAILQFGLLLHDYVTLTHAADVGARTASVSRDQPNGVQLARNAVIASASDLNAGQLSVSVTPQPWSAGSQITVGATYPYSIDILGIVVTSGNLSAQTTARAE